MCCSLSQLDQAAGQATVARHRAMARSPRFRQGLVDSCGYFAHLLDGWRNHQVSDAGAMRLAECVGDVARGALVDLTLAQTAQLAEVEPGVRPPLRRRVIPALGSRGPNLRAALTTCHHQWGFCQGNLGRCPRWTIRSISTNAASRSVGRFEAADRASMTSCVTLAAVVRAFRTPSLLRTPATKS